MTSKTNTALLTSGTQEIDVSKLFLSAHVVRSFLMVCCRGHAAYIKKQRNAAWELKFQQDGIRAQQAFEAEIRYLNRLYYGRSDARI